MKIGFHGAARTVTGSKYLLTLDHYRLLVDCGLFQGGFEMHQRNWRPLAFSPASVDDVLFTHAHIDHTGYFPRLAADGFTGRALATPPTKALLGVLLPDSGGLQEEEARFANKKGFSRHQPAKALYTEDDANRSLQLLQRMEFDQETPLHKGMKVTLHRAGHILGAAFAEIRYRDPDADWKTVVFSGDLGRRAVPILHDPAPLPACDVLVCESTYGDRLHEATDPKEQLRRELVRVLPARRLHRHPRLRRRADAGDPLPPLRALRGGAPPEGPGLRRLADGQLRRRALLPLPLRARRRDAGARGQRRLSAPDALLHGRAGSGTSRRS